MVVELVATLTLGFVHDGKLANARNHALRICFIKNYQSNMIVLQLLSFRLNMLRMLQLRGRIRKNIQRNHRVDQQAGQAVPQTNQWVLKRRKRRQSRMDPGKRKLTDISRSSPLPRGELLPT